ncbi:FecR family protein [Tellurirhabdus bombi]|uniref:FecR family protein n=1 Tax=Tellurirhabdus bombi TaxID=2907205 RepID=UPI001F427EE5|nr:FecR domain-containing protein [Tellurirhabdus bombi]
MKYFSAYTAEELAIDDLFIKWVQHPDDAEIASFWEGWLANHPHKFRTVEMARQIVLEASQPIGEAMDGDEAQSLWGRIRSSIQEMPEVQPLQPEVQSIVARWYFFRWLGAAVAIVFFIGWVLWSQWSQTMVTIRTAYGTSKNVKLPDGSEIMMTGNSQIRYARVWAEDMPRAVWLEGDAYFDVAHRGGVGSNNRFRVHTSNLTVEVEGTQFNVSQRRAGTKVVLSTGKIRLMLNDRPQVIEMKPGESIEVKADTAQHPKNKLVAKQLDSQVRADGTGQKLVIKEISLSEIATLIQDTYGLTVHFQNPALADICISGIVPNSSINVLLAALARLSELNIDRYDSMVVITSI